MPTMNAHPAALRLALGPARGCPGDGDQAERMIHLVAHADLEDVEHIGRRARFREWAPKAPRATAIKAAIGAGEKEKTVHGTLRVRAGVSIRAQDNGMR